MGSVADRHAAILHDVPETPPKVAKAAADTVRRHLTGADAETVLAMLGLAEEER